MLGFRITLREAGYRIYCDEDFIKLQQITTLKFIGLSLEEIRQLINEKGQNIESIISIQTKALEEKKKHIETVITNYALHHLTTTYKQKAIEKM